MTTSPEKFELCYVGDRSRIDDIHGRCSMERGSQLGKRTKQLRHKKIIMILDISLIIFDDESRSVLDSVPASTWIAYY